jgi:hypothetical protein
MISEKIVVSIKDHAQLLTNRLLEDLYSREETMSYRKLDRQTLYHRVFDVYSRLDAWLQGNKDTGEVRNHYTALGRQRFHEEIPLEETLMALMLIKRHLWLFVINESDFLDSSFMLNQALEFNNRVVLFFDRAIYFTTIGYMDEMAKAKEENPQIFLSKISRRKIPAGGPGTVLKREPQQDSIGNPRH